VSPGVVITGLGAVGPWGAGREPLADRLESGRASLSPLPAAGGLAERRRLSPRPRAAWAGQVAAESLAPWLPAAAARRMSRPSRMAVAAARMALTDAGLTAEGGGWQGVSPAAVEAAAVVLATAYGPSSVTEELEEQILLQGPEAASPALFAESVANAPAAQVARITGARGANLTVTAREAGPLLALRQAVAELASGRSALALAGAVDEITPLLQAVFDRFGALARGERPGEAPTARPFDRRRHGFTSSEGSAVVVLESAEGAAARGVRPLARVSACGAAFDATAPRHGWGTGHELLGRALRRTVERSGDGEVDLVVSGAAGSVAGDRLEALSLRAAWGEAPLPPVVAPKGVLGELGGGLLAAGVLAAVGATFGPAAGFREADPELGVVPWSGGPLPGPVHRVLLTNLAPGGTAAWVVLEAA